MHMSLTKLSMNRIITVCEYSSLQSLPTLHNLKGGNEIMQKTFSSTVFCSLFLSYSLAIVVLSIQRELPLFSEYYFSHIYGRNRGSE